MQQQTESSGYTMYLEIVLRVQDELPAIQRSAPGSPAVIAQTRLFRMMRYLTPGVITIKQYDLLVVLEARHSIASWNYDEADLV